MSDTLGRARLRATIARFALLLLAPAAGAQGPAELDAALRAGEFGPINSFLAIQGDTVLFEGYYRGTNANTQQLLNSATKSIGDLLIGVAERQGRLRVDETLEELLPQYDFSEPSRADKRGIRLIDVLQMRSGIAWDELSTSFLDPSNSFVRMTQTSDWYDHVLTRPMAAAPDARFNYNTGGSLLMGAVIRARTGQRPQDYLQAQLLTPLGITDLYFELWSPQGRGNGIRTFPFDDAPLGVGLWLRPRELARFGRLVLDGGVYEGRRLVDAEWIERSLQLSSDTRTDSYFTGSEEFGYGWQWWYRGVRDVRGREHPMWSAIGAGRQYLLLFPELDLIIVSTGDSYTYTGDGVLTLLREFVLPTFDQPLRAEFAGSWYAPDTPYQGINFEVVDGGATVIGYWYTYANGEPRWYFMSGPVRGDHADLALYRTSGGGFLDATRPAQIAADGTATLRFSDCNNGTLAYDFSPGAGSYAITRLTGRCSQREPPAPAR